LKEEKNLKQTSFVLQQKAQKKNVVIAPSVLGQDAQPERPT
jgi:hypothetical protein